MAEYRVVDPMAGDRFSSTALPFPIWFCFSSNALLFLYFVFYDFFLNNPEVFLQ
tara:strand:+ start:1209 stop:1370 length:162 start_codon:yes stop_codon:yes gene_type:complete